MTTTESVTWMLDGSGELEPMAHRTWRRAMTLRMSTSLALDLGRDVCQVSPEREWVLAVHHADAPTLAGVIVPAIRRLIDGPFDQEFGTKIVEEGLGVDDIAGALGALCAVGAALALNCGQKDRAQAYAAASLKVATDEEVSSLAGSIIVDEALAEPRPMITDAARVEAARAVRAHRQRA